MEWLAWAASTSAVAVAIFAAATVAVTFQSSSIARVSVLAARLRRALALAALVMVGCYGTGMVVSFAALASQVSPADKAAALANTIEHHHRRDLLLLGAAAIGFVLVRARRSYLE